MGSHPLKQQANSIMLRMAESNLAFQACLCEAKGLKGPQGLLPEMVIGPLELGFVRLSPGHKAFGVILWGRFDEDCIPARRTLPLPLRGLGELSATVWASGVGRREV